MKLRIFPKGFPTASRTSERLAMGSYSLTKQEEGFSVTCVPWHHQGTVCRRNQSHCVQRVLFLHRVFSTPLNSVHSSQRIYPSDWWLRWCEDRNSSKRWFGMHSFSRSTSWNDFKKEVHSWDVNIIENGVGSEGPDRLTSYAVRAELMRTFKLQRITAK